MSAGTARAAHTGRPCARERNVCKPRSRRCMPGGRFLHDRGLHLVADRVGNEVPPACPVTRRFWAPTQSVGFLTIGRSFYRQWCSGLRHGLLGRLVHRCDTSPASLPRPIMRMTWAIRSSHVIACGTSLGVGSIKDGCTVEVTIDRIGSLTNRLQPMRPSATSGNAN
jgi:hypothetical protein